MAPEKFIDPEWSRKEVLEAVKRAILVERNATYGPPEQDFARTADILCALGFRFTPTGLNDDAGYVDAHHIAMLMIALKLSRLCHGPGKLDSWVDVAGYAACGAETYDRTLGAWDREVNEALEATETQKLIPLAETVRELDRRKAEAEDAEKYPKRHVMNGDKKAGPETINVSELPLGQQVANAARTKLDPEVIEFGTMEALPDEQDCA